MSDAPKNIPESLPTRQLTEEIGLVLALSLLPSVIYSIIDLLEVPVRGSTAALFSQDVPAGDFWAVLRQFVPVFVDLAPVWLVLYLLRRSRESLTLFGLTRDRVFRDLWLGSGIGVAIMAAAAVAYAVSYQLELHRFLIPAPPAGRWWTVPLLVLAAVRSGVVEEVIVTGYLLRRLEQLGWTPFLSIAAASAFRGAFHLYQGVGGLLGNLALGFGFGWAFYRWRRTWILVAAHAMIDISGGFLFLAMQGKCLLGICL